MVRGELYSADQLLCHPQPLYLVVNCGCGATTGHLTTLACLMAQLPCSVEAFDELTKGSPCFWNDLSFMTPQAMLL